MAHVDEQRHRLVTQLAEKDAERERVLTLHRRNLVTLDEAEAEIDIVARETATVREMLESLRAQEALVSAQEALLTEAAAMLAQLREEIGDIEATNDTARRRRIVELLVSRITITSEGSGRGKPVSVSVVYSFRGPSQVSSLESSTAVPPRSGGDTPAPSSG